MNQNKCLNPLVKSIGINEKMTPDTVVSKILDSVEQCSPDIFKDPTKTFLNIYSKVGEIEIELYNRLNEGLKEILTDDEERKNHIITKQIYSLVFKKSLKLLASSNIKRVLNVDSKVSINMIKATLNDVKTRNWKEIKNKMGEIDNLPSFDFVLGNPPYQEDINGHSRQVHFDFLLLAQAFAREGAAIVHPLNWLNSNEILEQVRPNTRFLHRFGDANELFPTIGLTSGAGITVLDMNDDSELTELHDHGTVLKLKLEGNYNLDDLRIKNEVKFTKSIRHRLSDYVGYLRGTTPLEYVNEGGVLMWYKDTDGRGGRHSFHRVSRSSIPDDKIIDEYKVLVSKFGVSNKTDTIPQGIINNVSVVMKPGEVVSESNYMMKAKDEEEATLIARYVNTRFFRRLIHIKEKGVHVSKGSFDLVPDYTEWYSDYLQAGAPDTINELDDFLANHYSLSDETVKDIYARVSEKKEIAFNE